MEFYLTTATVFDLYVQPIVFDYFMQLILLDIDNQYLLIYTVNIA